MTEVVVTRTPPDRTEHIPKFGGAIWYVNKVAGSNTNSGTRPDDAFETIGAGITAMGDGDALSIKAGTYVEESLNLSNAAAEMWCEIGVLLDPPSNTALTVSGASCRVTGDLKITPDPGAAIGLLVTGAECHIDGVKVLSGSDNIRVTGSGVVMRRCASGFPSAGNAAYDIQGAQGRYIECNCVGNTTSYGFLINGGSDTGVLEHCTSVDNQTAGYHIATGCKDWTLLHCSSGAGDGRWVDVDHANVWAGFEYADTINKTTTFAGVDTTYDIFTLTGAVRISEIYGTVETVIPNTASTIHLEVSGSGSTVDITDSPGVNIQNAVAGAILVRNGPSTENLDLADPNSAPAVAENTTWKDPKTAVDIVRANDGATVVRLVLSAALASGAIDWHCKWEPLSDNGFLAAA